jgi:hypothetical protein
MVASKDDETSSDLIRTISRHSLAYMLCAASEMFRHYDFDPLDLLIIHAVLNANVLNIMKDPELDRRFGSVQTVEPDEIKQGVSRAGLSRFLALPVETVRRRADRLKKKGILKDTDQGADRDRGQSIQIRQQSRAPKNQCSPGAEIPSRLDGSRRRVAWWRLRLQAPARPAELALPNFDRLRRIDPLHPGPRAAIARCRSRACKVMLCQKGPAV